jgi:hypothetical protein
LSTRRRRLISICRFFLTRFGSISISISIAIRTHPGFEFEHHERRIDLFVRLAGKSIPAYRGQCDTLQYDPCPMGRVQGGMPRAKSTGPFDPSMYVYELADTPRNNTYAEMYLAATGSPVSSSSLTLGSLSAVLMLMVVYVFTL